MFKNKKNNLKDDEIRFIIYKKGNVWQGVALELNIIEVHKDPNTTLLNLIEAITGYIETAIKNNIQISSIKQNISKEYENIWNNINKQTSKPKDKNIYMFGKKTLINA